MTLKIDKQTFREGVVVQLAGDFGVEYLAEVKTQLSVGTARVVMDVRELTLVTVEGVRFLNACEDDGVAVINASPYISAWMRLERDTARNQM